MHTFDVTEVANKISILWHCPWNEKITEVLKTNSNSQRSYSENEKIKNEKHTTVSTSEMYNYCLSVEVIVAELKRGHDSRLISGNNDIIIWRRVIMA